MLESHNLGIFAFYDEITSKKHISSNVSANILISWCLSFFADFTNYKIYLFWLKFEQIKNFFSKSWIDNFFSVFVIETKNVKIVAFNVFKMEFF